jgi:hypothetical protein
MNATRLRENETYAVVIHFSTILIGFCFLVFVNICRIHTDGFSLNIVVGVTQDSTIKESCFLQNIHQLFVSATPFVSSS